MGVYQPDSRTTKENISRRHRSVLLLKLCQHTPILSLLTHTRKSDAKYTSGGLGIKDLDEPEFMLRVFPLWMIEGFTGPWIKTKSAACVFDMCMENYGSTKPSLRNTVTPTVSSSKFRKYIHRCDQDVCPKSLCVIRMPGVKSKSREER